MRLFLTIVSTFIILSCSNEEKGPTSGKLRKETLHFFSDSETKDRFVLEFLTSEPKGSPGEYTHFDILSGSLLLSIYDDKSLIYRHRWAVSDCFSMADNHYLSVDQKIDKFRAVYDHFFDSAKFNGIDQLKITGILKSSDSTFRNEIMRDPHSIGFSFIQEDFCVMYARKSRQSILLRALRKDYLLRYNLLNERSELSAR